MNEVQKRFWILVISVVISGIAQGMLLPVIAIILENNHISSTINGLHATGLAIGVLLISPFLEKPLRKLGYRPILILGGGLVVLSLITFPFVTNLWFWFILRIFIGIGDHALHFTAQTWITSTVEPHELGKKISIYGLSFGIGFMIGPMMTNLVQYNEAYPFFVSGILCFIAWLLFFGIQNDYPKTANLDLESNQPVWKKYQFIFKMAWMAMLPPLAYGIIESCISSNFPVYALRLDFSLEQISIIVPAFALGGILTQVPLGILSDKYGGKQVITFCFGIGSIIFLLAGFSESSWLILFFMVLFSGMTVASLFSLGLKFMSERIPIHLLPTANIIFGIFFSSGYILGPSVCGVLIDRFSNVSLFTFLAIYCLALFLLFIWPMKQNLDQTTNQTTQR
ncbi:MAG TPA: MFS transporter [Firmicutes bacterium]|nr:MFS transporter [Bacillota bacterium]